MRRFFSAICALAFTAPAFAGGNPGAHAWASEFDTATINVERNATDGDTEIVISVVPGDEGLQYLSVRAPNRRSVIDTFSLDRSIMGMREFNLESPEPAGDAIIAAYPQGI